MDGALMPPRFGSRWGRWGCTLTALGWATAVDKLRQAASWPGVLREGLATHCCVILLLKMCYN